MNAPTEEALRPDLSIVIPALDEAGNIGELVRRCLATLEGLEATHEIFVIDGGSKDATVDEARAAGARTALQTEPGYGGALREGFESASGRWILTMDSDLSHEPEVIAQLWEGRERADVVIASRYAAGGAADMSLLRAVLSRILNVVFTTAYRIPIRDISSGFRLYRREAIESIPIRRRDFDVLEEILIRIHVRGGSVAEIPFHYRPRKEGRSHARLFKFGLAYARTFFSMLWLRWGRRRASPGAAHDRSDERR